MCSKGGFPKISNSEKNRNYKSAVVELNNEVVIKFAEGILSLYTSGGKIIKFGSLNGIIK